MEAQIPTIPACVQNLLTPHLSNCKSLMRPSSGLPSTCQTYLPQAQLSSSHCSENVGHGSTTSTTAQKSRSSKISSCPHAFSQPSQGQSLHGPFVQNSPQARGMSFFWSQQSLDSTPLPTCWVPHLKKSPSCSSRRSVPISAGPGALLYTECASAPLTGCSEVLSPYRLDFYVPLKYDSPGDRNKYTIFFPQLTTKGPLGKCME